MLLACVYVATHHPQSLARCPVQDLGADIVQGVRKIKGNDGPNLIVWGSSTLTSLLLENESADELVKLVFPVLLGNGKHLFAEVTAPREMALVSNTTTASGVAINILRPNGVLRVGSFDA